MEGTCFTIELYKLVPKLCYFKELLVCEFIQNLGNTKLVRTYPVEVSKFQSQAKLSVKCWLTLTMLFFLFEAPGPQADGRAVNTCAFFSLNECCCLVSEQ
jgi:hypothetical protein